MPRHNKVMLYNKLQVFATQWIFVVTNLWDRLKHCAKVLSHQGRVLSNDKKIRLSSNVI